MTITMTTSVLVGCCHGNAFASHREASAARRGEGLGKHWKALRKHWGRLQGLSGLGGAPPLSVGQARHKPCCAHDRVVVAQPRQNTCRTTTTTVSVAPSRQPFLSQSHNVLPHDNPFCRDCPRLTVSRTRTRTQRGAPPSHGCPTRQRQTGPADPLPVQTPSRRSVLAQ